MKLTTQAMRPPGPSRQTLNGRALCAQRAPSGTSSGTKLLILVFLLTIFEGALRKWVVSGSPPLRYAMYFSKDIVFVCAALVSIQDSRWTRRALMLYLPFSAAALLVPTLANFGNIQGVGLVLSFRAYVVLPMCAFIAAGCVHSIRDINAVIFAVALSTIVVAGLGVMQFFLPSSHYLNRYETGAADSGHIVEEAGHARVTGTFAFITGMGIMTGVGAWAGAYLFLSAPTKLRRLFAIGILAAGALCALTSTSRGGAILYGVTVLGGILLFRRARDAIYLIAAAVVAFWVFNLGDSESTVDPGLSGGLVHRFQTADTPTERFAYVLMNLQLGLTNHPLGEGPGTGQIGGNFAVGGARSAGGGYESELGRVGYEVGILGFAGVVLWRVAGLAVIWTTLRATKDRNIRALCAVSLPLFGLLSLNYMAFNHTGSSFAWAILALVVGAARLTEISGMSLDGPLGSWRTRARPASSGAV
jgi:hypothetical protein